MVFKVNPQAKVDIQEQIHFYNDKQKGLGKRFHNDVKSTFKSIRKNPFYQIRYKDVRCLPLKKFPTMVHYTLDENKKTDYCKSGFSYKSKSTEMEWKVTQGHEKLR